MTTDVATMTDRELGDALAEALGFQRFGPLQTVEHLWDIRTHPMYVG